jgi:RNA polymerase sigma-70 factor, ECF subfamily
MKAMTATVPMEIPMLRKARAGDRQAFAGLVAQHQSMVFGIACHFLREGSLAEDVSQEVFLELYRNLDRIASDSHLVSWLRQVTSRKCIDQARRQRVRPRVGLEDAPEPAVTDRFNDPLASRILDRLVAALPGKMRMVVVLRYQEEMEPAEIAEAIGMPVASVKSLLHRGLELLRSKMTRAQGES